jgi:hypothetical protein
MPVYPFAATGTAYTVFLVIAMRYLLTVIAGDFIYLANSVY